jgi:hypothetical protein
VGESGEIVHKARRMSWSRDQRRYFSTHETWCPCSSIHRSLPIQPARRLLPSDRWVSGNQGLERPAPDELGSPVQVSGLVAWQHSARPSPLRKIARGEMHRSP